MSSQPPEDHIERIRAAICAGQKIEAIKIYRDYSGKSLKECKEFVETLEAELRQRMSEAFTATTPTPNCSCSVGLVCLLVTGALAWAWWL